MSLCLRFLKCVLLTASGLYLSACQFTRTNYDSVEVRHTQANSIALQGHLVSQTISTSSFDFLTYQPKAIVGDVLKIYIEGDGYAWENSQTASKDPTPINPIGLRLAVADRSGSSVYLARPCQYQDENLEQSTHKCSSQYWTNERFSEVVVLELNLAIDQLKKQFHAKRVILIGYSGGGALAILCAARRNDVKKIVTISGNVSVRVWTQEMSLGKLNGSLDPIDYIHNVEDIPQWHFIGTEDQVVPQAVVDSYASSFPKDAAIKVIKVNGFGHQCCWSEAWPYLLEQIQ